MADRRSISSNQTPGQCQGNLTAIGAPGASAAPNPEREAGPSAFHAEGHNTLDVHEPSKARSIYRRWSTPIHTVLTIILGGLVWQFAAAHTSRLALVPLQDVWKSFITAADNGSLGSNFVATFEGFIVGLVIASIVGIALGVLMAISKLAFDFLDPWVSAGYSTPLIALAPIFIIVFGIDFPARVAVVFTVCIFPVLMNTTAGMRTTDVNLLETARAFGASRRQLFWRVMLPWSVPFIVTGLRLAVGAGLIGVVIAEFFGSTKGLGHAVFAATQLYDTAGVWMGVIILAIIGVILIRGMLIVERKVAPWRASQEV